MDPSTFRFRGAKVVAWPLTGQLVKGYTFDFDPRRPQFHVFPDRAASGEPALVFARELKAVFFVRDLGGNPQRSERKYFRRGEGVAGRRIEVTLLDGEQFVGTAEDVVPGAHYVPFVPVDPDSNNLRVYAARPAVAAVRYVSDRFSGRVETAPVAAAAPAPAPNPELLPFQLRTWLATKA